MNSDQISDIPPDAEEMQFQKPLLPSLTTYARSRGEEGEPPQQMFCDICAEIKENEEMFRNESCTHLFCTICIGKHVAAKVQEGIHLVSCPGLDCRTSIHFHSCQGIVPNDVLVMWGDLLCQSVIPVSEKYYCPYRNCSAMLVNDSGGTMTIRESECPFCNRLFCALCHVPWHSGVECEEFQRLGENERGREDVMVMDLAKQKSWRRCPSCKFYVEKIEGCMHMTCRCRFEFCYACGATWSSSHGGCR